MKCFALYNLKGGVGKTTSCVNLAYFAARDGYKTLIIDLDPQGAASFYLQNDSSNGKLSRMITGDDSSLDSVIQPTAYDNLFLLPGSLDNRNIDILLNELTKSKTRVKKFVTSVKREFDYIFVDCPPSLSLTSENAFRAADYILLPTIPTTLSERTYEQIMTFFAESDYDARKILPFFTLVDSRRKMHQETMERFRADKRRLLRSTIPYSSVVEKMGEKRAPIHQFSKRSNATTAYRSLWQELKWFKKLK
ncbi:MAG: ParA family protein [Saprospiraceae bacterium]